jgi:hypothetical protein
MTPGTAVLRGLQGWSQRSSAHFVLKPKNFTKKTEDARGGRLTLLNPRLMAAVQILHLNTASPKQMFNFCTLLTIPCGKNPMKLLPAGWHYSCSSSLYSVIEGVI